MSAVLAKKRRRPDTERSRRRQVVDMVFRALYGVPVGDLERLAGLDPEHRTAFWLRYGATRCGDVMLAAGTGALLARIAERVLRGQLSILPEARA